MNRLLFGRCLAGRPDDTSNHAPHSCWKRTIRRVFVPPSRNVQSNASCRRQLASVVSTNYIEAYVSLKSLSDVLPRTPTSTRSFTIQVRHQEMTMFLLLFLLVLFSFIYIFCMVVGRISERDTHHHHRLCREWGGGGGGVWAQRDRFERHSEHIFITCDFGCPVRLLWHTERLLFGAYDQANLFQHRGIENPSCIPKSHRSSGPRLDPVGATAAYGC